LTTMIRIADDDVAISSFLCVSCTEQLGSKVYPPPLVHSSEEGGSCVKVIDVCEEMCGAQYTITRLNRNAEFVMTGVIPQARTRFLPPLNPPLVTRSMITGWIAGWMALDLRRDPNHAHTRAQGLLLVLELLRLGHQEKMIESALRAIQHVHLRRTARYLAESVKLVRRRATKNLNF